MQKPGGSRRHRAAALFAQGSALQGAGRLEEAAAVYRQVLAQDANHLAALLNLGGTLQALGDLERARTAFERALAIDPADAHAHCNFGTALLEDGEIERARQHFERARILAPQVGRFHRYAVEVGAGPIDADHLQQMEALAGTLAPEATDDRINLAFALAKAYDQQGDYARSFRYLQEGNALVRSSLIYDESETLRALETLPAMFGRDLFSAMAGAGDRSPLPIFILGMPRSGTTVVEQILAAHPQIRAGGELRFFEEALRDFSPVRHAPQNVEAFAAALADELRKLGARYVRRIEPLVGSAARVTDKNPFNFRFAGVINLALPNAHLIHVRRSPLDTCFSCFSALFSGGLEFAYEPAELGRYYRSYERLMAYWSSVLPAEAMLEVRYEDLVTDFEREARRIVAHCGLAWDDACTDFWSVKRPVRTASAVGVRQPLYRSSIGRAEPYRAYLEPLVRELENARTG